MMYYWQYVLNLYILNHVLLLIFKLLSLLSRLTRVGSEGGEACVGGWCGLCRRLVESWNGWVEEVVGGVEGI